MDNSLVTHLLGYIDAMFKDMHHMYASDREWQRDKTRLLHEVACNGEKILTIHMPALAKHFDKCLDQGEYSPSSLYLGGINSRRIQVPSFLKSLYLLVFDKQGKLRHDPSIESISWIRQSLRGMSKVKSLCERRRISDEVKNFKRNEDDLRRPTLQWLCDDLYDHSSLSSDKLRDNVGFHHHCHEPSQGSLFSSEDDPDGSASYFDREILQQICDRISSSFGDFHLERPHELPKHGPGRVSNQSKEVSKYHFVHWPEKLDRIFPYDLYARTDFGLGPDRARDRHEVLNHEPPAKLIAVPKDAKGPRLIASEPNSYQWIQQLVRNQLENRLNDTVLANCISFGDQTNNARLALESSRTGSHVTVDLKSASDRLSCWTVERVFRVNPSILERIHACRSRSIANAINPSIWDRMVLKKCFSQGNACTFPTQSIVYGIFCIAAVVISDLERQPKHIRRRVTAKAITQASKSVRVFGDDLIVPRRALATLQRILSFNQLRINPAKTYPKGKFRESCGTDAYDGVDVTPAYVRTISGSPNHDQMVSVIECSNNLFQKGCWHLANWLSDSIRERKNQLPIVPPGSGLLGLTSFCGLKVDHLKRRYNQHLHREEFQSLFLHSKVKKERGYGTYSLFQYFIERPPIFEKWEAGTIVGSSSVMRRGWLHFQA